MERTATIRRNLWALVPEDDVEQRVLNYLADVIGADRAAWAITTRSRHHSRITGTSHFTPAEIELYEQEIASINPLERPASERLLPGRVIRDEDLLSWRELSRTRYYSDWVRPHWGRLLACLVEDDGDELVVACFTRRVHQGAFDDGQQALLRALLPDLVRIFWLSAKREPGAGIGDFVTRRMGECYGVLALDGDGRVLDINPLAEQLVAESPSLSITRGRLVSAHWIEQLFDRAMRDAQPQRVSANVLGVGRTIQMDILPVGDAEAPISPGRRAQLMIVLKGAGGRADPRREPRDRPAGLSEMEWYVVRSVIAGKSLREIAEVRRRSLHTIRSQLKSVFRKTGTSSQLELVRRFGGASLPEARSEPPARATAAR